MLTSASESLSRLEAAINESKTLLDDTKEKVQDTRGTVLQTSKEQRRLLEETKGIVEQSQHTYQLSSANILRLCAGIKIGLSRSHKLTVSQSAKLEKGVLKMRELHRESNSVLSSGLKSVQLYVRETRWLLEQILKRLVHSIRERHDAAYDNL